MFQSCSSGSTSTSNDNNAISLEDLEQDDFTGEYSLNGNPYSGSIAKDLCYGVSSNMEIKEGRVTDFKILHPNKSVAISIDPLSGERSCYSINGDPLDYSGFVNEYYYYFVEPNNRVKRSDKNFSFLGIPFGLSYKDFYGQLLEKGFRFEDEETLMGSFYGEMIKVKPYLDEPFVSGICFTFMNFNQSLKDKLVKDLTAKYGDYSYQLDGVLLEYKWYVDNGEIVIQWDKMDDYPKSGITTMYYQNSEKDSNDL